MEPILVPITEVRLWVGLTPVQLDDLRMNHVARPAGCFGMSLFAIDAIHRAIVFGSDAIHPENFTAMPVVMTPLGYTTHAAQYFTKDG